MPSLIALMCTYVRFNPQEDPSWTYTMLQLCFGSEWVERQLFFHISVMNLVKELQPSQSKRSKVYT